VFEISEYIEDGLSLEGQDPENVLLQYVRIYQRWAKDCHYWAKSNRDRSDELESGPAKDVLTALQKIFCTSKNRQYERSIGYYFYGGTYDVNPEIESREFLNKNTVLITTKKKKPKASYRYRLIKRSKVWKIESLEMLTGSNQWRKSSV
jgi:hypothetical protein